jgi:hypothetical protein
MAVMQCVLDQRLLGVELTSTLYFFVDGGDSSDFVLLAAAIGAAWDAEKSSFSPDWELYSIRIRIPDGTGSPYIPHSFTIEGGGSGDPVPRGICNLTYARAFTASPNKAFLRIWGALEAHNGSDGQPIAGWLTVCSNIVDDLSAINSINSKGAAWVCASVVSNEEDPPHDIVDDYNVITFYIVRDRWYTLRSVQKG